MFKSTHIFFLAIILIALIGVSLLTKKDSPSGNKPVRVGVVLSFTGDLALFGEEAKKGIELALAETDQEKTSVKIFYEDSQSLSATAAANAANKLIATDKIDIGLAMIIEEAQPMMPIFNRAKIPLLITWDSSNVIQNSGEYIFSNGFSTEKAGESMAEHAYRSLGVKTVAILKHQNPWAETITPAFRAKFESLGGTVIFEGSEPPEQTDYRTSIGKLKNSRAGGIYFPFVPPTSIQFLTQTKQLDLKGMLLTGDPLIQDVIDAAGKAAEGVYFTNIFTEDDQAKLLTEKYSSKYGSDPIDTTLVSFGYDGMMKIRDAIEIAKRKNISLRDALEEIYGPTRSADRVEKIFQVRNGKPVPVE